MRDGSGTPPAAERLFVPLARKPFEWFESGAKRWELRRLGRQYTPKHVRRGRVVELRRGYGDPTRAIWGVIANSLVAPTVSAFFDAVDYRLVVPSAANLKEALEIASKILKVDPDSPVGVIGFEVAVDRDAAQTRT